MRGATPTVSGSPRCPARPSIHDGPGSQSLSTKAISSESTEARAVFRAGRGTTGDRPAQASGPVPSADRGHGRRVDRAVVDDDHRMALPERAQAALQLEGSVPHGHDHGDARRRRPWRMPGMGQSGIDQSTGELAARRGGDRALAELSQRPQAGGTQPQDPTRRAAKEGVGPQPLGRRIEVDPGAERQRGVGWDAQLRRPDHRGHRRSLPGRSSRAPAHRRPG